ncbi:MAG: hypothetical protein QXQ24_07395 [Nitrososphaeria archaeon]
MEKEYDIEVTKHFERLFRKLSPEIMKRIRENILELKFNPYTRTLLTGQLSGLRSIRVGDYRIPYVVN